MCLHGPCFGVRGSVGAPWVRVRVRVRVRVTPWVRAWISVWPKARVRVGIVAHSGLGLGLGLGRLLSSRAASALRGALDRTTHEALDRTREKVSMMWTALRGPHRKQWGGACDTNG